MTSIFAATAGIRSISWQRHELAGSGRICPARDSLQHVVAGSIRSGVYLIRVATTSGRGCRCSRCGQYLRGNCRGSGLHDVPASSWPDARKVVTSAPTLEGLAVLPFDVPLCRATATVFCRSTGGSPASTEKDSLPDHRGAGTPASIPTDDFSMAQPGFAPAQQHRAARAWYSVCRYSVVTIRKQGNLKS